MASTPYTLGVWTVKAGSEKSFIAAWTAFAKWTAKTQRGAGKGVLLQDAGAPQQFISFGPWKNSEAIAAWRESPEFRAFGAKVRELCDEFQPRTLREVGSSEE
jgi:heme-degrading monooxygenase HmoA